MTLFRLYKELTRVCNHLLSANMEKKYKSSNLLETKIGDDILIISLKSYTDDERNIQLDRISNIYFKLLRLFNSKFINDRVFNNALYYYHPKPKLNVTMNTVLSVIYINKYTDNYDAEEFFLDAVKFLTSTKYGPVVINNK